MFIRTLTDEQILNVGPLNNIGSGNYSNDNDYLEFDVHQAVIIESIVFFSNRTGVRTLDIRNQAGEIVRTKEIYLPASPLQATINIRLEPDSNYRISISDRQNSLYKNTSGANFPYDISNLISLKGSNLAAGHYPYFYRWRVSKAPCISNFKSISAIVDTSCVITEIQEQNTGQAIKVYPNPVRDQLNIEFISSENSTDAKLVLYNISGKLMADIPLKHANAKQIIDLSAYPNGIYWLKHTANGKIFTHKIVKMH